MYIPKIYQNDNIEEVRDFLQANSFGILVNQTDGQLWATHIPLELGKNAQGNDVLSGHISKANPQWKNFGDGHKVLAIFPGAHTYVSSSWYDHENVPTWNYIAVHVYGTIRVIAGDELVEALKKLVDKYEAGSKKPVLVENMSENFLKREMRGIVGFEIEVSSIHSAYKLSQNRDPHNHQNIVAELEKKGSPNDLAIAEQMLKHQKRTNLEG